MKAAVFATMLEAEFAIKRFGFKALNGLDFPVFESGDCALLVSGIGPLEGALSARFLLDNFRPEKICNFGACGALNRKLKLCDIVKISKVISRDSFCGREFKISEEGSTLITSTNPVIKDSTRLKLSERADVVDMEAYGYLRALELSKFDISKFSAIKLVSDISGDCAISEMITRHISKLEDSVAEFLA